MGEIILDSGITIGAGITIGPVPAIVDITTQNNEPLLTEDGDNLVI
jgi:hypothetical protein